MPHGDDDEAETADSRPVPWYHTIAAAVVGAILGVAAIAAIVFAVVQTATSRTFPRAPHPRSR
jgi:hypothetical protein